MVSIGRVNKSFYQNFGFISFIGDFLLLNSLFLLSVYLRYELNSPINEKDITTLIIFMNMTWFALMSIGKLYVYNRVVSIEKVIGKNLRYVCFLSIIGLTLTELLHFDIISRLVHAYFFLMFFIAIFFFRLSVIKIKKAFTRRGKNKRLVVIVGANGSSQNIANHLLSDGAFGYEIVGLFNDTGEELVTENGRLGVTGKINELIPFLQRSDVDELYFPVNQLDDEMFHNLIKVCERNFIRLKMLPNINRFSETHKVGIEFYGTLPVFTFVRTPLENYINRLLKRIVDVAISLILILAVFTWLFPILFIMIKMTSKGPVFFKQKRSGINNSIFWVYKFRTMKLNRKSDVLQAKKNDPRITKFGAFMRRTSIDELPQFFNVLYGNMSIVGPRPHMLRHTDQYSELIDEYLERHYILPGITGWAQVHGYRGETKKVSQMKKRVQYDIWYAENWSFLLDIRIMLLTTINAFRREENAY